MGISQAKYRKISCYAGICGLTVGDRPPTSMAACGVEMALAGQSLVQGWCRIGRVILSLEYCQGQDQYAISHMGHAITS
jgi:hypothetical protein